MGILPYICTSSSAVASIFSLSMKKCAAKPPKARSLRKRAYRATLGDYATVERRATDSLSLLNDLKRIKTTEYAPLAQLVEQLTLNQWVQGSSPWRCTKKRHRFIRCLFCAPGLELGETLIKSQFFSRVLRRLGNIVNCRRLRHSARQFPYFHRAHQLKRLLTVLTSLTLEVHYTAPTD